MYLDCEVLASNISIKSIKSHYSYMLSNIIIVIIIVFKNNKEVKNRNLI